MSLTERTEFTERKQKEQSVGCIFFRFRKKIQPTFFFVVSVSSSSFDERVRDASAGLPRAARGFSLVEVSLALLIVGIGILTILGMFPAGLDQNVRSISDTHAALFAGEVFSSLRVHAETTNWQEIGKTINSLPAAATNNWDNQGSLAIQLDNAMHTNIYRHPDNTNMIDHTFRYQIALTTNGLIKAAFLRFWPGEYGTASNPALFYSEFYQMNR